VRFDVISGTRRLRLATPATITAALVLTAATGASAVTVRLAHDVPADALAADRPATARLSLPEPPAPAAEAPGTSAQGSAVSPALTQVPRPDHLIEATLLVTSPKPLSDRTIKAVNRVSGVVRTHSVAAGSGRVNGNRARILGVRPAGFRPWTPKLTARSQPLWQSIARGELTASFDMGKQTGLINGSQVPIAAGHRGTVRIGAFASMGMAGVDAVMSEDRAVALGLRPGTGLVISAPKADSLAVKRAVHDIVARGKLADQVHTSLLREVVVIRDAGEFLTRVQINTMLKAAVSRLGVPYVWGATGPNSFDCSGLVQWAFAKAGIYMPRVSQQQWLAGPHVAYEDALPGDLLFWHYDPTDRANIDHVAIYAGDGMMIVAPKTGDVVKYVPVPLTEFAGVVRVDPRVAAQIG
jgi:cell wall-associated NlpC family hydrolase